MGKEKHGVDKKKRLYIVVFGGIKGESKYIKGTWGNRGENPKLPRFFIFDKNTGSNISANFQEER